MFIAVFSNGESLKIEARHNAEAIKVAKLIASSKKTTVKTVTKE